MKGRASGWIPAGPRHGLRQRIRERQRSVRLVGRLAGQRSRLNRTTDTRIFSLRVKAARRGLLVRHLVMPNHVDDARLIFEWLADEISPDTYMNIMDQYRPLHQVGGCNGKYGAINRRPRSDELDQAFAAARHAGLWRFDERW